MATPVKPGARNDLYALKEARRYTNDAAATTQRVMDELDRMRQQSGRPDYSRIADMVGKLGLQLAKISTHQDEMWTIRQTAGQTEDAAELASRVADLESTVTLLQMMLQKGEATWTP